MTTRSAVHPRLLARLQAINDANMPDTAQICWVDDDDAVSDGQGGYKLPDPWPTKATVPCRIETGTLQPQERHTSENILTSPWEVTARIEAITAWVIVMPVGTVVPPTARIIVGSRTFEVIAPRGPHSYDTCLNVVCKEIT